MLHQLTYISTSRSADGELEKILAKSRSNNRRDQLTGLLISDGVRFLQALEGHRSLVRAAFERISADPRHRGIVVLSERDVPCREFGNWDMASQEVGRGRDHESLAETVDALVAEVPDANTKALFSSFARVREAKPLGV